MLPPEPDLQVWLKFAGSLLQNEKVQNCCITGDAGVSWLLWLRQNLGTPCWGLLTCSLSFSPKGEPAVIFP